jgi:hypothetical protein
VALLLAQPHNSSCTRESAGRQCRWPYSHSFTTASDTKQPFHCWDCRFFQELEESRKLYTSQKRALKDALSAAAERDAEEAAAGESGLEAATAAAEEEVERLTQVCEVHFLTQDMCPE